MRNVTAQQTMWVSHETHGAYIAVASRFADRVIISPAETSNPRVAAMLSITVTQYYIHGSEQLDVAAEAEQLLREQNLARFSGTTVLASVPTVVELAKLGIAHNVAETTPIS